MRTVGGLLVMLLVGAGTLATGGLVAAEPSAPAGQVGIGWRPCEEDPAADCGTVRLPIDWADPGGHTFEMAVARRKAAEPSRRIGVLLVNPGGPGGSGVDFALAANQFFSPDLLARFDIVGFDPRGIARSQPVRCTKELLDRAPSTSPANQAEFDTLARYNRKLRVDCLRNSGPIVDHADTLSGARDMDALRRALGEQKISFAGVSYGTLLGQQYAEEFGDRIRAMVLDSNMDHSLDTRRFMLSAAAATEDSFNEFVGWCARTSDCALHGRDVAAVWDSLLAKADRGELPVTENEMINRAYASFHGPEWSELATWLAALDTGASPASPRAELVDHPVPAVLCQDWRARVADYRELARLTDAARRLAPHMRRSPEAHSAVTGCIGWPDRVNNPQHRLRIDPDTPTILLLNALHDPSTGYPWAVNVHRQAPRSTVLLTYEGWGHGSYFHGSCTRGAADTYLLTTIPPPPGTRCPAVP